MRLESIRKLVKRLKGQPHNLNEIALGVNSEKSSDYLGYTDNYERFLGFKRHNEIKLLEIGVNHIDNLDVWDKYFDNPNTQILGMSEEELEPSKKGKSSIIVSDQRFICNLINTGKEHGEFDIIIDNGSKVWSHQKSTFVNMWDYLKEGGVYVCENIYTSYGNYIEEYGDCEVPTSLFFENVCGVSRIHYGVDAYYIDENIVFLVKK